MKTTISKRDLVLEEGQDPPSGPIRCWNCNHEWELVKGRPQYCPKCGHLNIVWSYTVPRKIEITSPKRDTCPEEEMMRTKKILKPETSKLTVGDCSIPTQARRSRKHARRDLHNLEAGLTVGDQSIPTSAKDSVEEQLARERAEQDGMTVGDRYIGRRFIPQPATTESQEIASDMMEKHRDSVEMRLRIREEIFEQEMAREKRVQAYRDSGQFEADLKAALQKEGKKR